jgi:O-antigen/teichoic acid export membrane protein
MKSLKISAVSNSFITIISLLIAFLLTPFIIKHCGKAGYGLWILANTIISYFEFLSMGAGSAINRYIPFYATRNDTKKLNEIGNTAIAIFSVFGIVCLLLSFIFAPWISDFYNVSADDRRTFINLVRLVGFLTFINFAKFGYQTLLTAREEYVIVNSIIAFSAVLRAVFTYIFIFYGFGILGVAFAFIISRAVTGIAEFIFFRIKIPDISFNLKYIKKATFIMLCTYGSITVIVSIANILRLHLDSVVISKFLSVELVASYAIGITIIRHLTGLIYRGVLVLTPRFSAMQAGEKTGEIIKLLFQSTYFSSIMGFGFCTAAILFGPRFITLWIGEKDQHAIYVLLILAIAYPFYISQAPAFNLLFAFNKHHLYAFAAIGEGICNLGLSLLLVRHYGVIGVALGTAIPMVVFNFLVIPNLVAKILPIHVMKYYGTFMIAGIGAILLFYVIHLSKVRLMIVSMDYFGLAGASIIFFVIWFVIGYGVHRFVLPQFTVDAKVYGIPIQ